MNEKIKIGQGLNVILVFFYIVKAANIPMIVVGKLIQAISNLRQGHTGQLSAITVFLQTVYSLSWITKSYQQTGRDMLLDKNNIAASFCVNVLLTLQVIYYWNTTNVILAGEPKKTRN